MKTPLLLLAVLTSVGLAQSTEPAVKILAPDGTESIVGEIELSAQVIAPGADVRSVTFFVDGQQACVASSAPFRCNWDAGHVTGARTVRVVAELADGRRLIQAVRTPARVVVSASVDAILVPVHVYDNHGRFVQGLDRSSFRLLEDGVPQDLSAIVEQQTPLSILLVLDATGSMSSAIPELRQAAATMLADVRAQDRVTLAAFNETFFLLSPEGVERSAATGALARLRQTNGATALYDAMIQGARLVSQQPSPRVLVVMTDGDDNASHASAESARAALLGANVALYFVAQGKAAEDKTLRDRLSRLAAETGGSAWFAPKMSSLGDRFVDVVRDFTAEYVLVYVPQRPLGDGQWRRLSVEAVDKKSKYEIKSREGYFAVAGKRGN